MIQKEEAVRFICHAACCSQTTVSLCNNREWHAKSTVRHNATAAIRSNSIRGAKKSCFWRLSGQTDITIGSARSELVREDTSPMVILQFGRTMRTTRESVHGTQTDGLADLTVNSYLSLLER